MTVSIIMVTVGALEYTAEAVRQIEALTGKVRRQVEMTIQQIAHGQRIGKALRGELAGI